MENKKFDKFDLYFTLNNEINKKLYEVFFQRLEKELVNKESDTKKVFLIGIDYVNYKSFPRMIRPLIEDQRNLIVVLSTLRIKEGYWTSDEYLEILLRENIHLVEEPEPKLEELKKFLINQIKE